MLEMFFSTGILLAIIFALCGNYCFTGPPVIFFFWPFFLSISYVEYLYSLYVFAFISH